MPTMNTNDYFSSSAHEIMIIKFRGGILQILTIERKDIWSGSFVTGMARGTKFLYGLKQPAVQMKIEQYN